MPVRPNLALARIGLDEKAVNVTVTLPRWLRDLAVANNVKMAQVLQHALREVLDIEQAG